MGRGLSIGLSATVLVGVVAILSCGDADMPVGVISPDQSPIGRLEDYVTFEPGGRYVMGWAAGQKGELSRAKYPEPVLCEEASLGERFIDIDSDGVYEPPADTFDISRHDLNGNGRYDSPADEWTPEIPFDDLNGDGIRQTEVPWPYIGHPFADLNGNGVWDKDPFYTECKVCSLDVGGPGNWTVSLFTGSGFYEMISDSGVHYSYPAEKWAGSPMGVICGVASGRFYTEEGGFAFSALELVLDTGVIERRSQLSPGEGGVLSRLVTVGHVDEFRILSKVYRDALLISVREELLNGEYQKSRFYAVRGGGLFASYFEQEYRQDTLVRWFTLERFSDDSLQFTRP